MNFDLLIQYRSIKQEILELQDRIDRIYSSSLYPKGSQLTGMPRPSGYSNDGMIRIFEKIEELTEIYREKQAQLNELCRRIEKEIEELPSLERRIIRLRYIDGKGWSEIGKTVGCSRSTLYRVNEKITSEFKSDALRNTFS